MPPEGLQIHRPDGQQFLTYSELGLPLEQARERAEQGRERADRPRAAGLEPEV